MGRNKIVSFCTLGCKVNQYESDAMKERFEAEGFIIGDFNEAADIYIVNTCTVTNIADRKSRQMLHRAGKKNPDALIVAVGCYAQEAAALLEKDTMIDLVVGNNLKSSIVELVKERLAVKAAAKTWVTAGTEATAETEGTVGNGALSDTATTAKQRISAEPLISAGTGAPAEIETTAGTGASEEIRTIAGTGASEEIRTIAGTGASEEIRTSIGTEASEEIRTTAGTGASEEIRTSIGTGASDEIRTSADTEASAEIRTPEKAAAKVRPDVHVLDMTHEHHYEEMTIHKVSEHTRAFIKIQDGCNQFCSYCIIPYARGRVRSRQPEDVCLEVQGLIQAGYKEIVLTGIHISSYGLDFDHESVADNNSEMDYGPFKASRLIDLIEKLAKLPGLERIRFGSLEPRIITDEFLRRLAAIPQICPHFHLSLQSGCDATLRRMNRHYTTAVFAEKTEMIRRYFEHPYIATDVIVGFPGETEEEFTVTRDFLARIAFADMHIFKYSKRQGTKAAEMKDQIDPQIQSRRSEELLTLAKQMHRSFVSEALGSNSVVLTEEVIEINGRRMMSGYTENYIRCLIPNAELTENCLLPVVLEAPFDDEFVMAKTKD